LPDVKGREAILQVHSKKVKMAADVDLGIIARGTPGYSGAELANVINEAALLAARKNLKAITLREMEEARDKVRWGKERRSLALSEKEKENTAYHEAGHAICLVALEHTEPLHKVTIIPRGPSLGSTMWLPAEDKYNTRKNELLDSLVVAMGGRVAEEIVFGDVTSGASGDIKMATSIAKRMVCEWGMSEEMGMVEYGEAHEHVFLARDMSRGRDYSEATAQKIDIEVKKLIDNAYQRAKDLLLKNRTALDTIAKGLLEFETLDGPNIKEIMDHGQMSNPPRTKPPAPPSMPARTVENEPEAEGGLPGSLAGVPA
jgi:cell division protease FtsH